MSFDTQKTKFLEQLLNSEAIDPEGIHHEFNQGLHGQKIDFDTIETDSKLFWLWVELVTEAIRIFYPEQPDLLVGVANGTNRIIEPVSRRIESKPEVLETVKKERSSPVFTEVSRKAIQLAKPIFVLVIEDVGNKGTNTLSVVQSLHKSGVTRVEVLNTLQRSRELELLQAHSISYRSILTHILQSLTAEECKNHGPCAKGWQLIPYET